MALGEVDISHEALLQDIQRLAATERNVTSDLRSVVLRNSTPVEFVTSDNPAIFFNKWYAQKLPGSSWGLQQSGLMMYMPLSPRLAFLGFDQQVYNLDVDRNWVSIRGSSDISVLNALVAAHSIDALYFSKQAGPDPAKKALEMAKDFTVRDEKPVIEFVAPDVMRLTRTNVAGLVQQCGGDGTVQAHDFAVFQPGLPRIAKQRPVDRFPGLGPDRTDGLLQNRLLGAQLQRQPGKGSERCRVLQMECQFLVAQLAVLLEQGASQHRLGRQTLPSGRLDPTPPHIAGHQAEQIAMLIQPSRHRLQLAADLVFGETIEQTGLDGAFLAHCRLRRWRVLL